MSKCILVTGIPAAGKSSIARYLSKELNLPLISKDDIKERLFDEIGFQSRTEKVRLGSAAMQLMYDMADRLLTCGLPCILENNFENASRDGLMELLDRHGCEAITVNVTGDYRVIYDRFMERNQSPQRHRGHVVNDCYPEKEPGRFVAPPKFEDFAAGIEKRGMDGFAANGKTFAVDTTDWQTVRLDSLVEKLRKEME